jgi:hypothetical protein
MQNINVEQLARVCGGGDSIDVSGGLTLDGRIVHGDLHGTVHIPVAVPHLPQPAQPALPVNRNAAYQTCVNGVIAVHGRPRDIQACASLLNPTPPRR